MKTSPKAPRIKTNSSLLPRQAATSYGKLLMNTLRTSLQNLNQKETEKKMGE